MIVKIAFMPSGQHVRPASTRTELANQPWELYQSANQRWHPWPSRTGRPRNAPAQEIDRWPSCAGSHTQPQRWAIVGIWPGRPTPSALRRYRGTAGGGGAIRQLAPVIFARSSWETPDFPSSGTVDPPGTAGCHRPLSQKSTRSRPRPAVASAQDADRVTAENAVLPAVTTTACDLLRHAKP